MSKIYNVIELSECKDRIKNIEELNNFMPGTDEGRLACEIKAKLFGVDVNVEPVNDISFIERLGLKKDVLYRTAMHINGKISVYVFNENIIYEAPIYDSYTVVMNLRRDKYGEEAYKIHEQLIIDALNSSDVIIEEVEEKTRGDYLRIGHVGCSNFYYNVYFSNITKNIVSVYDKGYGDYGNDDKIVDWVYIEPLDIYICPCEYVYETEDGIVIEEL